MTTEEILKGLEWKDATETSSSIGILNEVYKGHELLLIKNSKTGAKRATIMIKNISSALRLLT